MSTLHHNNQPVQEVRDNWRTRARGTNEQEYLLYLSIANDGKGGDITRPGQPLKSFDEWLAS